MAPPRRMWGWTMANFDSECVGCIYLQIEQRSNYEHYECRRLPPVVLQPGGWRPSDSEFFPVEFGFPPARWRCGEFKEKP